MTAAEIIVRERNYLPMAVIAGSAAIMPEQERKSMLEQTIVGGLTGNPLAQMDALEIIDETIERK